MSDIDLRRGGRARLIVLAMVLIAPFGYLGYRIWHVNEIADEQRARARAEALASPAEVAELQRLLPELAAKLDTLAAQIKADVTRDAIDAALAADGGRCPYDIAREFHLRDSGYRSFAMMRHEGPIAHADHLPLAIDGLDGPRGDLADATTHLAQHAATHDDLANVQQDLHDVGGALILVGKTERAITVNGKYLPGHTEGDAILYLYRARAIVCAAHIAVTTPEAILVKYDSRPGDTQAGDRAADRQLEGALFDAEVDALSTQLRAVAAAPSGSPATGSP